MRILAPCFYARLTMVWFLGIRIYIYIYMYTPNAKFEVANTVLTHIIIIPPKTWSHNFRRILEGMKRKDLRKLASNATDELKTCDNTKKRWFQLIIVVFSNKVFKTEKKVQKKYVPFTISVFFHHRGFKCINLGSILHLNNIKYLFPDKLKIDESPPVLL